MNTLFWIIEEKQLLLEEIDVLHLFTPKLDQKSAAARLFLLLIPPPTPSKLSIQLGTSVRHSFGAIWATKKIGFFMLFCGTWLFLPSFQPSKTEPKSPKLLFSHIVWKGVLLNLLETAIKWKSIFVKVGTCCCLWSQMNNENRNPPKSALKTSKGSSKPIYGLRTRYLPRSYDTQNKKPKVQHLPFAPPPV